jgi:hypothetical protein
MIMQRLLNLVSRFTLLALIPAGMLGMSIPTGPAHARNQFDVCVEEMVNSGIPGEKAGVACSDALIPKELSQCVSQIRRDIDLPPEAVLQNCYQVRRPVDLANCVVDINADFPVKPVAQPSTSETTSATPEVVVASPDTESLAIQVLESCRRSLLPGRYSECVTATNRSAGASPEQALKTCLAAEDFPPDLFPAYNN